MVTNKGFCEPHPCILLAMHPPLLHSQSVKMLQSRPRWQTHVDQPHIPYTVSSGKPMYAPGEHKTNIPFTTQVYLHMHVLAHYVVVGGEMKQIWLPSCWKETPKQSQLKTVIALMHVLCMFYAVLNTTYTFFKSWRVMHTQLSKG